MCSSLLAKVCCMPITMTCACFAAKQTCPDKGPCFVREDSSTSKMHVLLACQATLAEVLKTSRPQSFRIHFPNQGFWDFDCLRAFLYSVLERLRSKESPGFTLTVFAVKLDLTE